MVYRAQKINFREVNRADHFKITFTIDPAYQLTPQTTIVMIVRPAGEVIEAPLLTFSTADGSITINGQDISFDKNPEQMAVRTGRFNHEVKFTKAGITSTLIKGIFEII